MTASIVPAAHATITRLDPRIRLESFRWALRFRLEQPSARLNRMQSLENSGTNLPELRAIAQHENPVGKKVEFISMQGDRIPEGVNYGYGEVRMLDEALERSSLRRRTTHMNKVTGHPTFPSVGKLIPRLPEAVGSLRRVQSSSQFPQNGQSLDRFAGLHGCLRLVSVDDLLP